MTNVNIKIYNISDNVIPAYEHPTDAGCDVRADFSRVTPENPIKVAGEAEIVFKAEGHSNVLLRLEPGSRALIPTGLFVAIPHGYEIQVRPRSGLAIKEGITVLNTPGTIDANYRGEIGIEVINHGRTTVWIEDGERIAQFVLNEVPHIVWEEVVTKEDLGETDRGDGGFNSTGKF